MMKKIILLSFMSILILGIAMPVKAILILEDHFNNGTLDPAWSITFQDATGWDYTESGTNLTVTDIDPTVVNPSDGGTWARVILSQDFTPLTDFDVDFHISWEAEGSCRFFML